MPRRESGIRWSMSATFCYFDLPAVQREYVGRIQQLRDNPQLFPEYYNCHIIVNTAYQGIPGTEPIDAQFVVAYHDTHARRYLDELINAIKKRLESTPVLNAMSSLFDPAGPVLRPNGDMSVAPTHLRTLLDFYSGS